MKNADRIALAGILVLAVSCGGKLPTIEGELDNNGAKGAYRPVKLVRNTGDSLTTTIDALCAAEKSDYAARVERIKTLNATADQFRRMPARTQIQEVMRGDSVDKYRRAAADEERAESLRPDTAYQRISELVKAATDTQVNADENGHFRFAKVKPSVYLLFVEWPSAKGDKEFLARVDATTKGKKTQNLDQSTVTTRLHCR
jgi:hypothetical protein